MVASVVISSTVAILAKYRQQIITTDAVKVEFTRRVAVVKNICRPLEVLK